MEIVANGYPLTLAIQSGVYAPLTDATWLAALARLSRLLSPAELVTVAAFYTFVHAIRGRNYPVAGSGSLDLQAVARDAFKRTTKLRWSLRSGAGGRGSVKRCTRALGSDAGRTARGNGPPRQRPVAPGSGRNHEAPGFRRGLDAIALRRPRPRPLPFLTQSRPVAHAIRLDGNESRNSMSPDRGR
jgi:hypothetical protein